MSTAIYIAVMAGVTYIIRVLPFTLVRKKIRSRFICSLLCYIPYAVLCAMTFPAIFYSTENVLTSTLGCLTALLLAYLNMPLIAVSLSAAVVAFISGLFL